MNLIDLFICCAFVYLDNITVLNDNELRLKIKRKLSNQNLCLIINLFAK